MQKVSCICVTGKDEYHVRRLLPVALRSFGRQTYQNLELVIVADWLQGAVEEVVQATLGGSSADVCIVSRSKGESLGLLRNAGLDAARGELCIQWDDDDWHHPERVEQQASAFVDSPVMLTRQIAYDLNRDVAFVRKSPPIRSENGIVAPFPPIMGTILHANDPAHRYPDMSKHEDTAFAIGWGGWVQFENVDTPELYIRLAHDNSTSGSDHVMGQAAKWPRGTWAVPESSAETLRAAVAEYRELA